jgi:HEAT repeat protein
MDSFGYKFADMRNAMLIVGVLFFCFVILAVFSGPNPWELKRREGEIEKLRALVGKVRQNPSDSAALLELASYADRENYWDRTQMFAQVRSLARTFLVTPEAQMVFETTLLPAFKKGLGDSDPYVRREAALAAREFGPLAVGVIPELIKVMREHPSEDASWFAAEALGNMGSQAREAIPALQVAAKEGSASLQDEARNAIQKIENGAVNKP